MTAPSKRQVSLLPAQIEFVTATSPKFIGYVGGYRAGKTYALCHKALYMAFQNPGFNGCLMMPTNAMARRVLLPTMEKVLEETGASKITRLVKSDPKFVIQTPHGSVDILMLSAENYQRAAGLSLAWFGIDEFDLVDPELAGDAWRMMVSRLTNGNHMQGFTTSTPEGFKFIYKFFQEEVERAAQQGKHIKDRRLIRVKTEDNPFITPEYVETLRQTYPPHLLKAYLEGEFVNMQSGRVYPDFDRAFNNTTLTIADFQHNPLHIGLDFNVGKMHSTVAVVKNGQPFVIDEITGLRDTQALIAEIKRRYPNRAIYCYPDASGRLPKTNASASDVQQLENAGFDVNAKKINPEVRNRVASVNAMICNGKNERKLLINAEKCPVLVKTLEQQTYVDGKPDKANDIDHSADAIGYFIYWLWPISKVIDTSNKNED